MFKFYIYDIVRLYIYLIKKIMEETNVIKNNNSSGYKTSIAFLLLVIISTISLVMYNNYLLNGIEETKTNISSIEANIKEVEKNESLQVYSLLELNKDVISWFESMNKVTKYISHMDLIEKKYKITFEWFNLTKWKIVSNVKILSDDKWLAYWKAKDFIWKYRKDSSGLFDLGFVNSIEWMDDMKFKVDFKIK